MSLEFDVFTVDPKPIPSAVPGFEQAVGQATWPPSTSTLTSFLGLPAILAAFPQARPVALADDHGGGA